MDVSGLSNSLSSSSPAATKSTADETLQQLADQGDPIAIAELKQQQQQENPAQQPTGPSEPGKGENVDTYV
jgi:hypothetical protein